ncbi:DUF998 domain-containing protein [Nakamurella aerolata]|uniref:DUF998 domain-containing protein n=1 Tax=Nakamurella aerolata TaxID=1656892 RepID=A0A849A776_9ACTN|nr:DUF998 domain-containing protein [Nakamurella aerolata]NNG36345.1 DUF998 domain-containing protein [Nakamurella aerolata]
MTTEPALDEPVRVDAAADPRRAVRRLSIAGLVGIAISCALEIVMHITPGGRRLDPLRTTISEYALVPGAWMFAAGVLVLAAASVLIGAALHHSGTIRFRGGWAVWYSLWCVGLVGLTVITKTMIGPDPTVQGRIHWSFTLLAFVSLPIALLLVVRRHVRRQLDFGNAPRDGALPEPPAPHRAVRIIAMLTWISFGWFAVLAAQTVLSLLGKDGLLPWVGIIERGVATTEIVAVGVLAWWVLDRTAEGRPAGQPDTVLS